MPKIDKSNREAGKGPRKRYFYTSGGSNRINALMAIKSGEKRWIQNEKGIVGRVDSNTKMSHHKLCSWVNT